MEFLDLLQNNLEQISKYYDKVIFNRKNVTLLFTTAMYEASVCLWKLLKSKQLLGKSFCWLLIS